MQIALVSGSRAPLRAIPNGASEMVSELLFGEVVEILETQDTWVKIRNLFDNYSGWMDIRLLERVDYPRPHELLIGKCLQNLILPVYRMDPDYGMRVQILGMNSFFPEALCEGESEGSLEYQLGRIQFFVGPESLGEPLPPTRDNIINQAEWYLNTPYLWGGRSSFGIDCSGLVQQVFRSCGVNLPRDAKDQAQTGQAIPLEEGEPGDVAFFCNPEGKITHTGIILGDGEIIHASGFVKTDELLPDGILDRKLGKITHRLRVVNTYFTDC